MTTQLLSIRDSLRSEENSIDAVTELGHRLKRARRDPCTRIACANCRNKKLKCTGEQEGCQRCRSKGYDCYYDGTGSRPLPLVNMGRATSYSERPVYPSPRSTSCNIQTGDFDFDSGDMHCPNLEPRDSSKGTKALEAVPIEAFDDFFSSYTEQPTTTDWSDMIEIDSDLVKSFLPTGPSCASSNGAAHNDGGFRHAAPDRSTSGKCVCVQKAMLTHEDICINVLWSMRRMTKSQLAEAQGSEITPSTVAEMLQCIKRTTRSNEELLCCHISCERQGFMVLIVMMCDIMLDGLESLVQQLRHDGLSGDMKHQEHNSHMQTLVTTKAPELSSPFSNMQFSNSHRGMGANDSVLSSSGTRAGRGWNKEGVRRSATNIQQPTLHKSPWILDEEDELRVIHSLIAARVENLSSLIRRLQDVGNRNQQMVYKEAVNDMHGRLKGLYSRLTSNINLQE